jgi:hypothetical protein
MTELDGAHTLPTNDDNFSIGCLAYEIVAPKSISIKRCSENFKNNLLFWCIISDIRFYKFKEFHM